MFMAEKEKKKEEEMKVFESLISTINNKKIEIKAKANEKGHLFKAVSHHDVASAIKDTSQPFFTRFFNIKRATKNNIMAMILKMLAVLMWRICSFSDI